MNSQQTNKLKYQDTEVKCHLLYLSVDSLIESYDWKKYDFNININGEQPKYGILIFSKFILE